MSAPTRPFVGFTVGYSAAEEMSPDAEKIFND